MSWEEVDSSFDGGRPDQIVIHLDLLHFGEMVGRVADQLCRYRGIEPFDVHSEEAQFLAIDAWRYVCHMADRAEFVTKTEADLAALDAIPVAEESKPAPRRPAPIGWDPPV